MKLSYPSAGQQSIDDEAQPAGDKRAAGNVSLPINVRQRVAKVESVKRSFQEEGGQAKFVRFDADSLVPEPSPKQPRTSLYSPVYAGNVEGSPAESSPTRLLRRVVEELELYDKDEIEVGGLEELWDWESVESSADGNVGKVEISEEKE
eukprot:s634_g28.t1